MSPCVAHFPSLKSLSANPYWSLLAEGLTVRGWEIDDEAATSFGAHWLRQNRGRVGVLHFHYVQQHYAYEKNRARLRWVLRLGRNLLLARLWGYRTVFTLHNLAPTYPLWPERVDYLGHWLAVKLCDAVIVHCEAARDGLRRRFGRSRGVHTVPHPHYASIYPNTVTRSEARTRLGLDPDAPVYLFFGGLRPNKGIDALCEAFGRLTDKEAVLLIAGSPGPTEYMRMLRAACAQCQRIWLRDAYVPDDQVQLFMNAADVVVLPFARILTSGSTMLALSFGKPVVAPAMGCLPELVSGDVGLLYDVAEPEGLVSALESIRQQDTVAMGRRAAELVQHYTVERFTDETLRAYGVPSCA